MGYYTSYSLQIRDPKTFKELPEEFAAPIFEALRSDCEEVSYSIDEQGKDTGNESRWYEHENDMLGFSKNYPTLLFLLHGIGEESGDVWIKYFVNGKVQVAKAKIQIEEFNASKLR